jgi:hypothetical protein
MLRADHRRARMLTHDERLSLIYFRTPRAITY